MAAFTSLLFGALLILQANNLAEPLVFSWGDTERGREYIATIAGSIGLRTQTGDRRFVRSIPPDLMYQAHGIDLAGVHMHGWEWRAAAPSDATMLPGLYRSRFEASLHAAWPVGASIIIPLIWLRRCWNGRPVRDNGHHCRKCGYDLRATPERCPECGHRPTRASAVVVCDDDINAARRE